MPSRSYANKVGKSGAEKVPDVREMTEVRAIFVSDLHLQARAPVARSAEPDWFAAMARPLYEIQELQNEHDVPIFYAGDIFDRWNAGPEVINFALKHLPRGYAIPGQHDLPNHNYDDIKRSAYWTLVAAGHLENMQPAKPTIVNLNLVAWGFPWGFSPKPIKPMKDELQVAIIHKFIWTKDTGYPGADPGSMVSAYKGNLAGFDVAVFGDNHKGFIKGPRKKGEPWICNCGGMMRRKTDERDYKPGVGLLHADGTVTRHYFDTSQDKFIEMTAAEETIEQVLDMTEFVRGLKGLGATDALDFTASIKRFLDDNDVPERVREIILNASE